MARRCTVPLLVILAAALAARFLLGSADDASSRVTDEFRAYRQLSDIISRQYVEEVKPEDLFFGAMEGMSGSLDDYTEFLSPDEYSEMMDDTGGEFGGLGIEIYKGRDGRLVVHTPLLGTPAEAAGIRPGDIIVRVLAVADDGSEEWVPTEDVTTHEAIKLLKGLPGTKVTIEIFTEGDEAMRKVTLERARIEVPSIRFSLLLPRPGKAGYVDLARFQDGTEKDIATAVDKLLADGMRCLILDLRHNPGGTLISAVKVADLFLDSGVIVSIRERDPARGKVHRAKAKGTYPKFPVAILIESTSASASEIVAAALQDHHRATLVGSRTFGKGSVQSIVRVDLGNYGHGAVKITSARYYTPRGISINREPDAKKWGVDPDIEVKVADEDRRRHWEERSKAWVELNSAGDGGAPQWPRGAQLDAAYEHLMKILGEGAAAADEAPAEGARR